MKMLLMKSETFPSPPTPDSYVTWSFKVSKSS